MRNNITLEVCCNTLNSVIAANAGGADRLELCDNIQEGGTTPSLSSIRIVRELTDIPIHILIRPRGGDFLYTPMEMRQILLDIQCCKELQIDGVVVGMLDKYGDLDRDNFNRVLEAVDGSMSITFHRALDMSRDPLALIEELAEYKVDRVLSSGASSNLTEGIQMLGRMQEAASGKIHLMAGGGITPLNVQEVIKQTGVREIHISGKGYTHSQMEYRNPKVSMSDSTGDFDEFSVLETQEAIVKEMKKALQVIV